MKIVNLKSYLKKEYLDNTLIFFALFCLVLLNHIQYSVNISYAILAVGLLSIPRRYEPSTLTTALVFLLLGITFFILLWNPSETVIIHSFIPLFGLIYFTAINSKSIIIDVLILSVLTLLVLSFFKFISFNFGGDIVHKGVLLNTSVAILIFKYLTETKRASTLLLIYIIAFLAISLLYKSRLLFFAASLLLLAEGMAVIKIKMWWKLFILPILVICAIVLLWVKLDSVVGRLAIWRFFIDNLPLKALGFTPFSYWYTSSAIGLDNYEITNKIGEVYSVAFNDYIQIFVTYGAIIWALFFMLNLFILFYSFKARDWKILSALAGTNLMLITSFGLQYPSSLFFTTLVYLAMINSVVEKNEWLFIHIRSGISFLKYHKTLLWFWLLACLISFYLPRALFVNNFDLKSIDKDWLTRPMHGYVLKSYDYKYFLLKKTRWDKPLIAEALFEVLRREYLSYDVLIMGAEIKEHLGKYQESLDYYIKASKVRPFTLFPKYKQLLLYRYFDDVTQQIHVLKKIDSLELRIQNLATEKMQKEIDQIRESIIK